MSKILIAIPVKPNSFWVKNANEIFDTLTYKNKVKGIWGKEVEGEVSNKYSKNCLARNGTLNEFLSKDIDYVFWIDSDVVVFPDNIIERLLEIDSQNVIAPWVIMEKCPENHFGSDREFAYDNSFFIDLNGKTINPYFPYHNTPKKDNKYEMSSVGTCMLVPAKVYREGYRYNPKDPRGDHIPFCSYFKAKYGKIFYTDEIIVEHSYLPKHNLKFH